MEKNNVAVRKRNVVLTVLFVLAIGTTAQLRAEQTPPKEPTYHNLRFKEDFSYLAGPFVYSGHLGPHQVDNAQ
jgi:hypothetical protein